MPKVDSIEINYIGETYHETRREIMLARQEGLTKIYNRFHDPAERGEDIVRLRGLHVQMDEAVAAAYGWGKTKDEGGKEKDEVRRMKDEKEIHTSDFILHPLELAHDFHTTAQGVRYTISESARREVLSRLLKLNHERWDEEQKAKDEVGRMKDEGKKNKGKKGKSTAGDGQLGLL